MPIPKTNNSIRRWLRILAEKAPLLLAVGFLFVGATASAQDIPRSTPEYQACYEKLTREPLASFADRIVAGGVTNTRRILLETELVGIRCSEAQLVAFMEHQGLPFQGTEEAAQIHETGHGTLDRVMNFCITSSTLIDWLLWGRCNGVVRIALLGDYISFVIAHGAK